MWPPHLHHIQAGDLDRLRILSKSAVNVADPVGFQMAVKYGPVDMVDYLVKQKADLKIRDELGCQAIHTAAQGSCAECLEYLVRNRLAKLDDRTFDTSRAQPIHLASHGHGGSVSVLERLLSIRADVQARDQHGTTPLHHAAATGDEAKVSILLAHRADPSLEEQMDGINAMWRAASRGHVGVLELFFEHGKEFGNMASLWNSHGDHLLHEASRQGFTNMVEQLIRWQAHVSVTDRNGNQPLHYAAARGHMEIAKLLVQISASLHTKGSAGVLPSMLAAHSEHSDVAEFLNSVDGHGKEL
eukprot:gnl/TRDRNA2_/TRDRNA2_63770_c0_seq1.p1 gnl/TRDRNA2_/TRDRNA2_63770_c0~~gnl/TRDRNA2_/TRDRNA2_63770_c0_seq1.p1  ORF type:complete len:323 (+),score=43.59 gnl/TRDRNA2_/TRDRNA2_63770_c0_seq1:71-970(+)